MKRSGEDEVQKAAQGLQLGCVVTNAAIRDSRNMIEDTVLFRGPI